MTNVYGFIAPERILGDIRGMVPDPLKGVSNEDQFQATRHKLGSHGGALDKLFTEIAR